MTAAAELLAERRFEEATVADLVRRGRSSVGSFYARFRSKEALLDDLHERLFEVGRASWGEFLASSRWEGASAGAIVDAVVSRLVAMRRERRGLLRALALYVRSRPDSAFARRSVELNRRLTERVTALLLERREIGHPKPERAVAFALQIADSVTRDAILFEETRLSPRTSDRELASELSRTLRGVLGVEEG